MTGRGAFLAALLAAGVVPGVARAEYHPPGQDADWPCMQIKVPELSVASFWTGPAIDPYRSTWSKDPAIADLVDRLSQRRTSMEAATAAIDALAKQAGPDRQAKLLALMAGLYDTLNQERASVLVGLDRFGRRQKELAQQLRTEAASLGPLPNPSEAAHVSDKQRQLEWDMQVFQDRRQLLSYACDVPNTIERRLFALARAIQQHLS
ncbi:MAG TPA: hypothetical protein VME92_00885 [Acetobacteraceae bacterium]|nr:hypothetical protein [Acetobacteraceae bacterium]